VFEIGNSLREARLRQGLDYPEIEQATKIRVRYLRALEEEEFRVLPASTYIKGFLRTYADYLGLDGGLYVDEYNSRYVVGEDEPPLRRSSATPRNRHRLESRVVVIGLAAIAIVTALVIAAFKSTGSGSGTDNVATQQPPHPKTTTHKRATKPKVAPATVIVTAASATYVKVRLGSPVGKQIFAGTLDAGQSHRWYAKRFWLAASDPTALRVSVNGRAKQLPLATKRVGVIVTASGVKASSGA
jgi:cytoskeletal protein RodZ